MPTPYCTHLPKALVREQRLEAADEVLRPPQLTVVEARAASDPHTLVRRRVGHWSGARLSRRAPAERGCTCTKGACRAEEGAQLWVISGRVPQQRTRGVRRAHQLVGLQADVELPSRKLGAARGHSLRRREDCGGGFGVPSREVRRVLLQRAVHGVGSGWQHAYRQPCVRGPSRVTLLSLSARAAQTYVSGVPRQRPATEDHDGCSTYANHLSWTC